MLIDNQLRRTIVVIYNSNQFHHFTSLKTNPENLDICFIIKFSNFHVTTILFLIPLTYFSVYLFRTTVSNYSFNINRNKIANFLYIAMPLI